MPRRSARLNQAGSSDTLGSTYISLPLPSTRIDDTTASDKDDVKPFRLLDLPPEIRGRIYSHVFNDRPKRDISYFSIPSLVLASKQLRDESLPVLFAENNFRIAVGGNFIGHHCERVGFQMWDIEGDRKVAGTVGFKRLVGNFLKTTGEAALFRNITFEVYDSFDMKAVRELQQLGPSMVHRYDAISGVGQVLLLHLEVVEGTLRVSVEDGENHPRHMVPLVLGMGYQDLFGSPEDADAVVEKATAVAQDMARRHGFKGFKLSDLRKVAKSFRLEQKDGQ